MIVERNAVQYTPPPSFHQNETSSKHFSGTERKKLFRKNLPDPVVAGCASELSNTASRAASSSKGTRQHPSWWRQLSPVTTA
jgi:hypothetical protein